MSESNQSVQIDAERIISKLRVELSEATINAIKFQSLAEQLIDENAQLRERLSSSDDETVPDISTLK